MGETATGFYPSKIKKIAIELKDYLFFHSPYQPGNQDRRFIGRVQPIRQLKTMLRETKSISGTYLITGSRGSGKTSFVNIVLAEIGEHGHLTGRGWQILRIWFCLLLVGILYHFLAPMPFLFVAPVGLTVGIWLIFWLWYKSQPNDEQSERKGFVKTKRHQKPGRLTRHSLFFISEIGHLGRTLPNLVQGLFIVGLVSFGIICISITWNWIHELQPVYEIPIAQFHFWSTIFIFIYWFALKFFDSHESPPKKTNPENSSKISVFRKMANLFNGFILNFKKVFRLFFYWLKQRLQSQFKPRLVIRLNLNYSNLNEREVLQLIAHTLHERYNKWRRTPFQLLLRGAQYFLLWLLVAVPYQTINKSDGSLSLLKTVLKHHIATWFRGDAPRVVSESGNIKESSVALPDSIYQDLNQIYKNTRNFTLIYFGFVVKWLPALPKKLLTRWSPYFYPTNLEPILVCIFGFFIVLVRLVLNRQWIFIPGHARVQYLLSDLNDRVAAAVTVGSGQETNLPRGFGKIFRHRSLAYPLADERTIEQGILRVLEEINYFPIILGRPVFYFVFDELDKIALPEEPAETTRPGPEFVSTFENIRRRQAQIEKVLSNLKQLLTTAPAKFIFIAGRELYDTCLADFTGRLFLHSSIFNQTFYIDSFLSDHSDPDDHRPTSLVESYICKFLLPQDEPEWLISWPKLTDYARYLDSHFEMDPKLKQKTLRLVEDFIFFCTYRGSGSPKKMTQLMEGYVQSLPEKTRCEDWIIIGENPKSRYLVFNFPQQFEICHTARLLQPISQTLEHVAERLNDKLTTSILMVLDYLFKFHKSAFRLDSLEWMPEMLYIHRDPDLRHLVYDILHLLENKYLEPVHNGLFDFRFSNRIRGEISFSSRTSTLESAVFNFSLDESREAEQFMLRQLWQQLEQNRQHSDQAGEALNLTTCRLYEKLGDLHAFNENYDQALTEYFNTLRLLKTQNNTGEVPHA